MLNKTNMPYLGTLVSLPKPSLKQTQRDQDGFVRPGIIDRAGERKNQSSPIRISTRLVEMIQGNFDPNRSLSRQGSLLGHGSNIRRGKRDPNNRRFGYQPTVAG